MRQMLNIFFGVCIFTIQMNAQFTLTPSVIATVGKYAEVDNLSISWTIGDLAVTTLQGDHIILTQGFQQPVGIGKGISRNEINGNIFVYPNPVKDQL